MLKNKAITAVFRFLFCWIIPAVVVGTIVYLVEYFIFKYKLRTDWNRFRYSSWLNELHTMIYLFFFTSISYFIYLGILKMFIYLRTNIKNIIWAGLFATGMLFLPYVLSMSIFQIIIYWIIMCITGLLIPLVDKLALAIFKKA